MTDLQQMAMAALAAKQAPRVAIVDGTYASWADRGPMETRLRWIVSEASYPDGRVHALLELETGHGRRTLEAVVTPGIDGPAIEIAGGTLEGGVLRLDSSKFTHGPTAEDALAACDELYGD